MGAEARTVVVTGGNRGIGRELARQLDVAGEQDAQRLADRIGRLSGHVDVLIDNAAIHYDTGQRAVDADLRIVSDALETNVVGALTDMGSGTPAYRVSKAALDALTRRIWADPPRWPPN